MDYTNVISEYISAVTDTLQMLDIKALNTVINVLCEARARNAQIFTFGNGGSAATASHFANDFNKGISEYTEKKFRFLCLNDNMPTVMAIANDIGYEEIFRFQLKGRLAQGDLVIGISGSGNSLNVVYAAEYAKSQGNKVIGITGYDGGKLKVLSDVSLHVPVDDMQITEDIHMIFDHLMMSVFYQSFLQKPEARI